VNEDAQRLQKALTAIRGLRARVAELETARSEPIAVVGLACRFPAAPDPDAYWRLLREGRSGIGDIPADRWDVDAHYDPDPEAPGRMYTRRGGFLDDVAGFDAGFFGISPREAKRMDPQQRLLLEVAWEALEHAGRDPRASRGSRTGVYVGISESEYLHLLQQVGDPVELADLTGTALSVAAGRLAYHLGLHGPTIALDTACSSALVAVHLAVSGLRAGEADLALAGGVGLLLAPDSFVAFCKGGALAADGRCKTFDAGADGYARGEGAGMVVLKRLADARRDGDHVHAVIRGTAVTQDGRTNGLTAPNGHAQEAVIRAALADARLTPDQVGYVEAHGTGTPLGDPIELAALGAVFGDAPVVVGAAKTNIGHLEAAAGMAGLIKVVQALRHQEIPPNLNFGTPNPHIPWDRLPVTVPTSVLPWPLGAPAAGVSSFGFSGTNAHVILEPAPPVERDLEERPRHVLALSARSEEALRELAGRHLGFLATEPDFADVCHTVATGRTHFTHRLAVPASTSREAATALTAFVEGKRGKYATGHAEDVPRVAMLFTGQGAQYAGMGAELYRTHPDFRRDIDQCAEILGMPLMELDASTVERTRYAQPALFAVEYALARLWQSWGVRPHLVAGHSTGEYAAACVAGVLSLEDALTLVAARARLIEETTSGGATAAAFAPVEQVTGVLARFAGVGVAGLNGPRETLIAGEAAAVAEALAALKESGVDGNLLKIPHAPHSPMVEPALPELAALAAGITHSDPKVRLVAGATGGFESLDASYWPRQMREPVRFVDVMATIAAEDCTVLLEVGPQPVLQLLGRQSWTGGPVRWMSSLWEGRDDWKQLLAGLGDLYAAGVDVDWAEFDRHHPRRRVPAPTYPFQRREFWFTRKEALMAPEDTILTDIRERIADWLETTPEEVAPNATFVELGAESLVLARLIQEMAETYGPVVAVGRLFDDLGTPAALATHLQRESRSQKVRVPRSEPVSPALPQPAVPQAPDSDLGRLIAAQVDVMARQLEVLAHYGNPAPAPKPAAPAAQPKAAPVPERELTARQRRHLDDLLDQYKTRTAGSLDRAVRHRHLRADTRMRSVRPETRSVCYPIIAERGDGARFWDVDGNSYLDIAMGVGVLLCGHNPTFVTEAVAEQLKQGLQTGPITALADEVAELVAELTGMERMFFAVTGTDAVRGALRMAQATTGRSRFVLFAGSYHGQDDRVLALPDIDGDLTRSVPMAPGISPGAAADALVLTYGSESALRIIAEHADELAGVLVEPVQSRNPTLQPKQFLHDLRKLTEEHDIPLIFDEVITGFRVHPGGAQAHFGVKPDLAAYGKVVGGGQPMSVVAGTAKYLDRVDGGDWHDGPGRDPDSPKTYIGSTFEMHPIAMASTRAILSHLKDQGPELQRDLTARTTRLAEALNEVFVEEDVPIQVLHFASVFRFTWKGNASYAYQPLEIELFHFHLLLRGIYIWEGRTCFLSTAHTDADVTELVGVVREAIAAMRRGGFLPGIPLGIEQEALLALERPGEPQWTVAESIVIEGPLDRNRLRKAVTALVDRHESLRTVFPTEGGAKVLSELDVPVELAENDGWWRDALNEPFDLTKGPLLRVATFEVGSSTHLALLAHHIVTDGWSFSVLVTELAQLYNNAELPPATQYREFLDRTGDTPRWSVNEAVSHRGGRVTELVTPELAAAIRKTGQKHGATLFMTMLAAYSLLIHRLTGEREVLIGVPQANRGFAGSESIVGYCAHFLPFRSVLEPGTGADHLRRTREALATAFASQDDFPLTTVFNLDRAVPCPEFDGLTARFEPVPAVYALVDFRIDAIEGPDGIRLDCDYRTDLYDEATARDRCQRFVAVLTQLVMGETHD
jgi:acyl transferase domain-containing protein/glutamate-1-semialdehyde aminotransferase